VYDGGVEFDVEAMHRYYTRVIELGDVIGRFKYCEWTRSPMAKNRTEIRGSRCKNKDLWRVTRKYANEHSGDPVIEFYNWIIRSGQLGTGDRRQRARDLFLRQAREGDAVAQYYLGRVYLGNNVRRDRAPDYANAFYWFSAASMGGNYHGKVMQSFLRQQLEQEDEFACVETYTIAMLNNLIATQNGEPAPNDTRESTQSCNEPVLEFD